MASPVTWAGSWNDRRNDPYALSLVPGWIFQGTGDPHRQHAGVVGRRDGVAGDVGGQLERPAERSVPDLPQRAGFLLFRTLIAVLAVDDQAPAVDLHVDVLVDVNARELDTYDRVVAVLDDLGAGLETAVRRSVPVRRGGGAEKSRNHRSVSQAGRDHNARPLMALPF
ncbi:hypothetical protein MYSE111917_25140 [Mycobacterium senriense]